ncbi:MAG: hypothetical protein IJU23_01120 [Proteobacteria bacterium]|nr:hypothetical protein [Pseudomonadota bacterium]
MRFHRILLLALCLTFAGCETQPEVDTAPVETVEQPTDKTPVSRENTLGPVHAVVTLSNETPRLGEPIELTLTVDTEQGVLVTMPDFGDQLGKFSIANFRSSDTVRPDGRNEYVQSYTLDLPMSGRLKTPSFLVEFTDSRPDSDQKDSIQELLTDEITFEVQSVFADGEVPQELYPAEGELPELVIPESKKAPIWPWFLLAFAIAVSGGVIYFATRPKKKKILPADVVALKALDDMEKKDIPVEAKAVDAWYVELSSVIRYYIEGRFDLHAPRLTTEEFFELTKSSDMLNNDEKVRIRKLLEYSDRVKFTDFVPSQDDSRDMLKEARKFVLDTRPKQEEPAALESHT